MEFQQQDIATSVDSNQDNSASLDFQQQQLLDDDAPHGQAQADQADQADQTSQAADTEAEETTPAAETEASSPASSPAQEHPVKQAVAQAATAPRPVPTLPGAGGSSKPAPVMDYRLFYLNNAGKFTLPNGKTDENKLNAAFYQTVRQTGAVVQNLSDSEFTKRLKKAGATYSDQQIQQALGQANKGYGDYERGRFNAFAGGLRNAGLDTTYNRRRGYVTAVDGVDTRPGEETAQKLHLQPRTHDDAGYTSADQVSQYYDQAKAAEADPTMPFRQTEVESQLARDQYQGGDKQVFVGSTQSDGSPLVSDYTVDKPQLSADDLVTSQADPRTGEPRLVVWRKDSDANRIAGQGMNIQALLPAQPELTLKRVVGDLIPAAGNVLGNYDSVWTGDNQTVNRAASWVANKLGYDPTRQNLESEGVGLGQGVAKGIAAVGASNQRLLGFGAHLGALGASAVGDESDARSLRADQQASYRRAAQIQGNLNVDQQGSMFSSLPSFFYNLSQQVGQQAIQQGLNTVAPGSGFAYMAGTMTEQGYSEGRRAGLGEGASTALGGALGVLTYASEKFFDIGIAKYGRKALTGQFEKELGLQVGEVLKREKTALLEGVLSDARQKGLQLSAAETTNLVEKAAPRFLSNVQTGIQALLEKTEKSAVGQVALATAKEAAQETSDQMAQTGAYALSRQWAFEDGHGKLKDSLAPWVKQSLQDGSNPLAEKGWNQITEEWYQAGLAGGLMGGLFSAPFARGMAQHSTLAAEAQQQAEQHKSRQIAAYLVENNFTPKAAEDLRQELGKWHERHQLGVRTKVDGTPASEDNSDSENTLVYQSLLNKVNVYQRLAQDTNLAGRLTPANHAALTGLLAEYGNENVRTSEGLDTLYRTHEKQQDIERLLTGQAPVQRDPVTNAPVVTGTDIAPTATTAASQKLSLPGFDPKQGALGLSTEAYKLEVERRRAVLNQQQDGEEKDTQLKSLEEEAGRAQDSGALGVITRNRAVGAWFEAAQLTQQLRSELTHTDGSDYEARQSLRQQILEADKTTSQAQTEMAQAVSQSADGSLSTIQRVAQAQLELEALREQGKQVFTGDLVRTHLQEGYLRHQQRQLDQLVSSEQFAGRPLYEQDFLRYQQQFLQDAFTSQPDGGQGALVNYNLRRKEFIAQRLAQQSQQQQDFATQGQQTSQQLQAATTQAGELLTTPTPEGLATLLAGSKQLLGTMQKTGLPAEGVAEPLAAQLEQVAKATEASAQQAERDPALRAQTLQQLLDQENQAQRQAAVDAGTDPNEVFTRTPEWVAGDPEIEDEYQQKVSAQLAQQRSPELTAQLDQASALRQTAQQLRQVPVGAAPAQVDETELERQWATHFAPGNLVVSDPGSVETVQPSTVNEAGQQVPGTTGVPGRINALQQELQQKEGESEANYATRVSNLDERQVDQLIAQSHYHLAQLEANQQLNNQLLGVNTLPAEANKADLKHLPDELADELREHYLTDYLPSLYSIKAALAAQAGSRYAKDDEHRALYLQQRSTQLASYVAGTKVLAGNGEAERRLQQASELLQQAGQLAAGSRSLDALTQSTLLLTQAENLLRQAFELAGPVDAQRAARQALHQEVLDGIELKVVDGEDSHTSSEVREAVQRYRQGLSYRGNPEDGVFIALQQLFGLDRAVWSQHYASVARQLGAEKLANGLPAPVASLEQEQAVLGINAFFQNSEAHQAFAPSSVLGRHLQQQLDDVRAEAENKIQTDTHVIDTMTANRAAFVSRHLLYVTGFPGVGKTAMVAGTGIATLASLRGATSENPLRVLAIAPHEEQRQNLVKGLQKAGGNSAATTLTPGTVSELLSQLRDNSIQADAIVLDEATILSSQEAPELLAALELHNEARIQQGQPPLKALVLGDPAQLAGKTPSGTRQAVHLFVKQRLAVKFELPTLIEIYRSGVVVNHQLQDELRDRILAASSIKIPGTQRSRNSDDSPVTGMAHSLVEPGNFLTVQGVQYQGQDNQRQQIVQHIKQLEAARAADPEGNNPESQRTVRIIVAGSDEAVNQEVAALTAAGIANAASYVEKAAPHGVLDVERSQGAEFDYVYASIQEANGAQTLRALNVAASRAKQYVSIRLKPTEVGREAELNNQQVALQQFASETAEARTTRTQQKLALLDAVAELAPKTGPQPTAATPQAATSVTVASDTSTAADDEVEVPTDSDAQPVESATPSLVSNQPLPTAAVQAVQSVVAVLAEDEPSTSGQLEDSISSDPVLEPETEDDQSVVADDEQQPAGPSIAELISELSDAPLAYLAKLEAGARTLRREVARLKADLATSPVQLAQVQEVLDEAEIRLNQYDELLTKTKQQAVSIPEGYEAQIPAGSSQPGQQGGVELVLDAGGQPVSARVWKPEFDSEGNFTKLREMKLPASELTDEQGQPKSELGKLRSVRRWLDTQVRELENKRVLLERASVSRLAAENKVVLHSHVMEAVADVQAREQRLTSKNNLTKKLYEKLFGQQRKQTATGQPTFDGTLTARDLKGVVSPSKGELQGNGQFYLVHHQSFTHGRVSDNTSRQQDSNIFTIRYQEKSGDYLDVGVIRNNSHEALAHDEIRKVAGQPSGLDILLKSVAMSAAPYPLGSSLQLENVKTPGRDRGLTSTQPRTLSEKYAAYAKQGLGASKPYVVTVKATDNVRLGSDYVVNNSGNEGGLASISGGAVIFTAQGQTNDQVTAVVEAALVKQAAEKWSNQQLVDYLLHEQHLELDAQAEQPLSLRDYVQAIQAGSSTKTAAYSADFPSAASLDESLTTQRGLDKKGRTVPVFKLDAATRKTNWQENQGGWMVKRSLFSMAQARPAKLSSDGQKSGTESNALPDVAYQSYGLLNKLFNVVLDSGVATQQKDSNGRKFLVLSEAVQKALTSQQAEHLQLVLNEFSQYDRHLFNDNTGKSYETRYNQDLLRYLGYLDQHGTLKEKISKAWDDDTRGQGLAQRRGKNEVQFRPSFMGKATGAFTAMHEVPGLNVLDLLASRRDGMTDPSFVVNLRDAAVKAAPVQQTSQQVHTNNQAVGQPAAEQAAVTGGHQPGVAVPISPAVHAQLQSIRQAVSTANDYRRELLPLLDYVAAGVFNEATSTALDSRLRQVGHLAATPEYQQLRGIEQALFGQQQAAAILSMLPQQTTGEVGTSQQANDSDLEYNLNDIGLNLGDAAPEEFISRVQEAFGKSVPWAFDQVGNFQNVLGAVIGEVITVNRASNGLVDRRTIKHEMVHYALRIVSPAYRQLVLRDARETLLPKLGETPDRIAQLTDKQVEEKLSKHYESVYQDYERRAENFKRRTKYIPDPILRLYRALRSIYDRVVSQPDFTERLFGDLERGLFRGRQVQAIYRGVARNADGSVNLDHVDYNRSPAGQRQHDFLELEKTFGSPQRREQALHLVVTQMQAQLNEYKPGKSFRSLPAALNYLRTDLLKAAEQTKVLLADSTSGFVLDNHSANPAHALRTRNYLLVQPFQQQAGEVSGEKQLRGQTTPLDVMVEYLYPHLKVNNRYDADADPYAQDEDSELSGSDGAADSNGSSVSSKANNIATKAYYLEDKNKAAKPGVELNLLLRTVPLYVKDLNTGRYQQDQGRKVVDFRTVNAALRRAVSDARQAVYKAGRTDVTLEDVRQGLRYQFDTQQNRGNYATGNRRDALASLYVKLFAGAVEGQAQPDGSFVSDAVPVQVKDKVGAIQTSQSPYSMYQVAYPQRAGSQQLIDHADEATAMYALHFQRLLSQLLGHYTSTQRREYLSIDLSEGVRENKDTKESNAQTKRKNYNQQALLNKFYVKGKGKKGQREWQPSAAPLEALHKANFTLVAAGTRIGRDINNHQVEEPRIVLRHKGREVLELGTYQQGAGGGFTATGTWQAGLTDQQRVDAAHQLLTLAGLPFDKQHLTEMLGTGGLGEEGGRSSFQGFDGFLGETLARVWTSALGDHALNWHQLPAASKTALDSLGALTGPVNAYLTGLLARYSEGSKNYGNWDDLNQIDGQGFGEGAHTPQYRLSPTAHFSKILGLAQYQNDWVRADVSDYTYSADGEKIYLEQLGNGVYPRLQALQAQRENVKKLLNDGWKPGQDKNYLHMSFSPETGRVDTEVAAPFDEDLFGAVGEYQNHVADGTTSVNVLQVNGLSDQRTGRKKSMVSATAAELHQLAVEHLFARPLLTSQGLTAKFFGAVISDKNTQRIFDLSQETGKQKTQKLSYVPGTAESHAALRNVYQSYQAFLHHQVLPRYVKAGFAGLSEAAQQNDQLALTELQIWLSAQAETPRSLVKTADHNGKGKLNQELVSVLTAGEQSFIQQAESDALADARRLHQDGYTFMPKELVDNLVSAELIPKFDQSKFATKAKEGKESAGYLTRAADGEMHPLLLTFTNSAFIHNHALQTALDGHHLNYKGAVDRAKRGIISATNYESYDVQTPRGLGASSKLLVLEDLSFAPVAQGQSFGLLGGYVDEQRKPRYDVSELAKKEAQDGQGYMTPLHAMLEDESLGGKYLRLATPDEMQGLGYERTAFPRKISLFGTRKNIHGDGRTENGNALLVKDSKTILTNNYLSNANEKMHWATAQMLGGYNSPLYQRWQSIQSGMTPQQLAANADWVQLYDEYIQPENRATWELYHHGVAAHPSAVKVGLHNVIKFGEEFEPGQIPHVVLDNRFGGKVLSLNQDPAGADISRITQEDHIISLLGDNFETAQQVYSLLGQLATDGLFDLDKQVKQAGGERFFMQRLQDLLLNLGNTSNTLSLVRAGSSGNVPLLLQPLHSAISSSVKQYSTKLRNKGLRATVQSSTGLVELYNVLDSETGEVYRLPKKTLLAQGYATQDERGKLVPTSKAAQLEADQLKFMHLRELETGRELSADEARAFMQQRLAVGNDAAAQVAFEAEARGKYSLEPMEMLIPRDFVKAFNIPAEWDVADVLNPKIAGHAWFVQRELEKGADEEQAVALGTEKWQNFNDILDVKGTRIPVTNMNSIQMGRVVGFHDGSQNVALVPSEMLLIAGADNDGDMITLEFLDLDKQGLRHRDQVDELGNVQVSEKGIREQMLTGKRDNVLLNPFNVDQLFKPIDLGRFGNAVNQAQQRESELRSLEAGEQGYVLPTQGAGRYAENIAQWITNQAGKSGVGPMVKAREAYNALHNYSRSLAHLGLDKFGVPSYWLGREVSSALQDPREVSYLFEDFANAALDNAKENYLGNLNFSQETWGVYSSLIMTRQNFADMMELMTHPYARRIVRRVQQQNTVRDQQRVTLKDALEARLKRTAPSFDEQGAHTATGEKNPDSSDKRYTGYGYSTEQAGTLFEQVQARQAQLHQSGQFPSAELLAANVGANSQLTAQHQHQVEQYILENLYLNAVRGDELLSAQGILATMDGVDGQDYDNQRGVEKVLDALPLGERAFPGAIAGDAVGNLQRILEADPVVQQQWAQQRQSSTKTINAAALVANNPFVQSSIRALLQDKNYKQQLFVARHPALQQGLQKVVNELSKFNGSDKRATHKLVMRGLDEFITHDYLQAHRPDISLEAQASSPYLQQLARLDMSTVHGRTEFGQVAAAYVEELKARTRNDAANPGVQDSPLVQELTLTGGDYGRAIQLNNAADLDPETKQVLESLFSELGNVGKYGVEGPALQQVLLYYNLSRNGLHLGKGSLAEVLSAESLKPVSDHARSLDAEVLAGKLGEFKRQLVSQNPKLTRELRAPKQLSEEDAERDAELVENGIDPEVITGFAYYRRNPEDLPDTFSKSELQRAGKFKRANPEQGQREEILPEFVHVQNVKSPGKVVLYRRSGSEERPVWRRQYSALSPAVNNYGEYGYSPLPLHDAYSMWPGEDSDDPVRQQLRDKAKALGLVDSDGRFQVKSEGNRTWSMDRELRCK